MKVKLIQLKQHMLTEATLNSSLSGKPNEEYAKVFLDNCKFTVANYIAKYFEDEELQ